VWSFIVVLLDPGGDHDPGLEQAVELLAVQQLVAHRAVEALEVGVLLRAALLDEGLPHAPLGKPVGKRGGDELAPLSDRSSCGCPWRSKRRSSSAITSAAPIERSTPQPSATRVYSSTTFTIRSGARVRVRPP
jgi:hypothetical protein